MKIIQSYAKHEFGSPYTLNPTHSTYLNFYAFLLSYITLKKLYGSVTIYTNKLGYDDLIKHIPYDEVKFLESNNNIEYWSYYKVNAIEQMNEDFIHVDTDVFLFNDLFRNFINSDSQVLVQDIFGVMRNKYMANDFVENNYSILRKFGLINDRANYKFAYSCGVIGLKADVINKYLQTSKQIKALIDNSVLNCNPNFKACVSEEVALYIASMKHNLKVDSVLPYAETSKNEKNLNIVANKYGYTHLWFNNKFKTKNIELIKNKIKRDYSEYYHYIDSYEQHLKNNNIILDCF